MNTAPALSAAAVSTFLTSISKLGLGAHRARTVQTECQIPDAVGKIFLPHSRWRRHPTETRR
jgi:hypothetical protein